ncbi:hypothetical protein TRVL_05075 [Trypanosoma vivax]|nr:hypothetical protein TRVL_05075 [Trypanosoma vivax]
MAFGFSLALLAAILLNATVLGDDATSSDALAGHDGERNAPSRGGDAGRKSEGRAHNGDKLVVLDSARATPSETVRKSVSVVRRMSGQSSLSNRNEARNDHVGVGNELPDQPVTSHKAQLNAYDKHRMKLPHAKPPTTSRHSGGGLTSTSPKESAGVVDRKKQFENMFNGIIAEEAENSPENDGSQGREYEGLYNGDRPYGPDGYSYGDVQLGDGDSNGDSSSVQNNTLASGSASSSSTSAASSAGSEQSPVTGNDDKSNTNDGEAPKNGQEERDKDKKEKEKEEEEGKEDGNENGEKQLEQKSDENSNGRETNSSSEDAENKEVPSSGNSAFLCGSYSSVLLVAVVCVCACAC